MCRWEEGTHSDGQKWKSLEHKGPLFPPEYEPLPSNVPFLYDGECVFTNILYTRLFSLLSKAECTGFVLVLGKPVQLSLAAEEVATFYAKMLDHEYTTKEVFQNNFFTDWREVRTSSEC